MHIVRTGEFRPYAEYPEFLAELAHTENVKAWLDPSTITMGTRLAFSKGAGHRTEKPYRFSKKHLKTQTEISSTKK